jgi:tetratricopeptide (TPR) repeat protein
VALIAGQWQQAASLFEESLELLRGLGDTANIARSLFNLGAAALESGGEREALGPLREGLALCVELGDKEDEAWCLVALAALAERRGEADRAALLLGAADRLLEEMEASFKPYERDLHERTTRALLQRLREDELAELALRGRQLGAEELLAEAFADGQT